MGAKGVISNGPVLRPSDPVAPGRAAVVTGAASGIGLGLAQRFAAEGLHAVMAGQDAGHLVNTSSIFGVFAGTLGPYGVSKHAVTALTETLYFNLQSQGVAHVGVSVICPGAVRTNFGASSRNRPAWAGPAAPGEAGSAEAERASAERFDQLAGGPPTAPVDFVWLRRPAGTVIDLKESYRVRSIYGF